MPAVDVPVFRLCGVHACGCGCVSFVSCWLARGSHRHTIVLQLPTLQASTTMVRTRRVSRTHKHGVYARPLHVRASQLVAGRLLSRLGMLPGVPLHPASISRLSRQGAAQQCMQQCSRLSRKGAAQQCMQQLMLSQAPPPGAQRGSCQGCDCGGWWRHAPSYVPYCMKGLGPLGLGPLHPSIM